MKNYESSLGPDWWGRLTAFGSLLVAGAALWYATVELPRKMAAQPADTERTSVDAELAKQLQRKIDEATSQGERVEVVLGRMESLHADVTQLASAVEERLDQYARSSEPAADPLSETAAGLASEGVNEAMDALETSPAMAGSDASLAPADLLRPPTITRKCHPRASGPIQRWRIWQRHHSPTVACRHGLPTCWWCIPRCGLSRETRRVM